MTRPLRVLALPTAAYVGITVVAPAMNGAATGLRFRLHAATVLGVCLVVLLSIAVAAWGVYRIGEQRKAAGSG